MSMKKQMTDYMKLSFSTGNLKIVFSITYH